MSRYIDADALKVDYIVPSSSTGTVSRQYVSLFQILNAPTADVSDTNVGKWIPVTKEEVFQAGCEGREILFRVNGRLFAIRELAQ